MYYCTPTNVRLRAVILRPFLYYYKYSVHFQNTNGFILQISHTCVFTYHELVELFLFQILCSKRSSFHRIVVFFVYFKIRINFPVHSYATDFSIASELTNQQWDIFKIIHIRYLSNQIKKFIYLNPFQKPVAISYPIMHTIIYMSFSNAYNILPISRKKIVRNV